MYPYCKDLPMNAELVVEINSELKTFSEDKEFIVSLKSSHKRPKEASCYNIVYNNGNPQVAHGGR